MPCSVPQIAQVLQPEVLRYMLTAVCEAACASDSLLEPGLGKPSKKHLGCSKVKHLTIFPLGWFGFFFLPLSTQTMATFTSTCLP